MTRFLLRYPALTAALGLFAATLPFLLIGAHPDGDAIRFHLDADAIRAGQLPYRDFYYEYPPGSIPLFTLPSIIGHSHWFVVYGIECAIAWAFVIVLVSFLVSKRWPLFALAFVPLALGDFSLYRMDAWTVACVLGAMIALTRGRTTLAYALLAVGTMVKSWPIALLPVFLLYRWTRQAVVSFFVIVILTLLPFVILTKEQTYNTVRGQLDRHLQLETFGSSVLLALGRVKHTGFDEGSWNVFGGGSDSVGKAQSLLQIVLILGIAWLFFRSRKTANELLAAVLATVTVFTLVGKVLSPQYLIWIAPFALLYPVLVVPFFTACVLTRELFPGQYDDLIHMHHPAIALLAMRNVILLVVLVLVLRKTWAVLRLPEPANA